MYKIKFSKTVLKFFKKHKWQPVTADFSKAVEILKQNPFDNNLDIKPLLPSKNSYRLRLWKYRIIFDVIEEELLILVVNANSRWDIYK